MRCPDLCDVCLLINAWLYGCRRPSANKRRTFQPRPNGPLSVSSSATAGESYGWPPEKLCLHVAYVDFDGRTAIEARSLDLTEPPKLRSLDLSIGSLQPAQIPHRGVPERHLRCHWPWSKLLSRGACRDYVSSPFHGYKRLWLI